MSISLTITFIVFPGFQLKKNLYLRIFEVINMENLKRELLTYDTT